MQTSFSARYFNALIRAAKNTRQALPQLAQAGEAVAERLLAGGRLFAASPRPDFVSEAYVRSGGLMLLEEWQPSLDLGPEDTVVFATAAPTTQGNLAHALEHSDAYLIGIGPAALFSEEGIDRSFDTVFNSDPPLSADLLARFAHQSYPLVSLQNLVLLWTFTAELVAALTRKGTMPTMYQSVLVPGARQRNQSRLGHRFEPDHKVPALPPGHLAMCYIDELCACFSALLATETEAIDQVARAGLTALERGCHIHAFLISHFPIFQAGAPGDPGFMQRLEHINAESPSVPEVQAKLQAGDLFFFLGYYNRPTAAYQAAQEAGASIAEIITGTANMASPEPDYIIDPKWPFGDSLVEVPGYDIPILPSSGILQAAIYWAVVGTISSLATP